MMVHPSPNRAFRFVEGAVSYINLLRQQQQVCEQVVNEQDVLLVLAPEAGKSPYYPLPGILYLVEESSGGTPSARAASTTLNSGAGVHFSRLVCGMSCRTRRLAAVPTRTP